MVGRNDDAGYGVRGFNTRTVSVFLGRRAFRAAPARVVASRNVNAANRTDVLVSVGNRTGAGLRVDNANAGATNLAVFQKRRQRGPHRQNGKGFFNGGTQTGGADVAEADPASVGFRCRVMWVMIDVDNPCTIGWLARANSAAVAGVITTKPGVLMNAGVEDVGDAPALALVGRVPVKVTDRGGSIRVGDLLVSSSTPATR